MKFGVNRSASAGEWHFVPGVVSDGKISGHTYSQLPTEGYREAGEGSGVITPQLVNRPTAALKQSRSFERAYRGSRRKVSLTHRSHLKAFATIFQRTSRPGKTRNVFAAMLNSKLNSDAPANKATPVQVPSHSHPP